MYIDMMVIKLEQWEELLLDRVEHLRMTVWRRSPLEKASIGSTSDILGLTVCVATNMSGEGVVW